MAQRLPNLFRRLFAEGAFNAAFVPMFAGRLEQGGQPVARGFARAGAGQHAGFMLLLTIVAEIAMPLLILVFAPGFIDDPDKFALTVLLTAIAFPYLLFMFLAALFGGILNSLHHFGHAAAAPILLNVVLTLGLLFVAPHRRAAGDWCSPGARPSPGCCSSCGSTWWRRSWAMDYGCPGRRSTRRSGRWRS